jgi:8-oxo-dGTP pyrophosphatase MutT (NUDIX family)
MVQRHHRVDFATGAMVFPGGKLEETDFDPALRARSPGLELSDAELALRAGAIRETFEEARVLLARRRGGRELLTGAEVLAIEARHRAALEAHEIRIGDLLAAEDLELACDLLVPFAHWITPEFMPKRFDTHFYLVAAPDDHVAVHDGHESVDSTWISPAEAVAAAEAGTRTIIFPTLQNVKKLGRAKSVAEAIAAARSAGIVTVLPRVVKTERGMRFCIPPEAGDRVHRGPARRRCAEASLLLAAHEWRRSRMPAVIRAASSSAARLPAVKPRSNSRAGARSRASPR